MMRRPLTTLMLVVTCGTLALGAAVAVAIEASAGAGASPGRAASSERRSWPLTMSAAPDDLTLAEVSFRSATHGQRISVSSLQVTVSSPFGDDYFVVATPRLPTSGIPRVLVLLVNRPSPLLDPVSVSARLTVQHALGAPLVLRSTDPLARSAGAHTPALCNLPLHGAALSASGLRPLHSRGPALAGFDAASALAQAYDLVCGLSYASSFAQAVEHSPASSPPTPPESSSPTSPAPAPTPPVGRVPGEGCAPTPGYACPAAFRSRSRAAVGEGQPRAAAGAY
jgi:hypothetical protein